MKKYLQIFAIMLSLVLILSSVGAVNTFALQCENFYADQDSIYGDVDEDLRVTVKDATLIQKNLAKITELEIHSRLLADVNADGKLSISDATEIQKYLALIITSFGASPTECYVADTDAVKIEIENDFLVSLKEFSIYIPATGYYRFTADIVEGIANAFYVGYNEQNTLFVNFSYADADTLEKYAYIPQGYYRAGIYTMDYEDTVVNFSITSVSEDLMPFNPKDAKEIKAGDKIEVKAGTQQLYKINTDGCFGSLAMLYTEGEDPKASFKIYNKSLVLKGMSYTSADGTNAENLIVNDSYIVVNQEEGGSDFTICCVDYFDYISAEVETINLDDKKEIIFTEENLSSIDGYDCYNTEVLYKFSPAESGYYKISISGPEDFIVGNLGYYTFDAEDGDDRFIKELPFSDETVVEVVDYLYAGATYLMNYGFETTDVNTVGEILLSTADEQDYKEYLRLINYSYDLDTDDVTDIALGEKTEVNLSLATDDEGWIYSESKVFRFTADKDMKVVVYSEGSKDAYAKIYNAQKESVWYGAGAENKSQDFAIAVGLEAGESCYIEVSGGIVGDSGDSYVLCVSDIDDYKPIN